MVINFNMNLQESIRRILREEKLYVTPQELIRNLPKDLKDILFKQWGAKQNPEWHPEGNTLKHILVVIKRAYHHYPDDPNMVMAALFHDLGKIDTYKINPKTGQPTAYGHEDKSTDYVEQFRDWIESFEGTDVDEIKYLVKNHMKVKPSTWNQMKDKKKEPIISHPAFDKLMGFTDKLDGGGFDIEKKKLQETIRRILREEVSPTSKIRRRTERINYEVKRLINSVYTPKVICKRYTGGNELTTVISHAVIENIYFNTFYDIDDESKEWEEIAQFIFDYIHENLGDMINSYYQSSCE